MKCLARATETSNIELYLLIQAYAQAAPQIILQLYYMLTQDLFRNYETCKICYAGILRFLLAILF